jgi:hypothetical protein
MPTTFGDIKQKNRQPIFGGVETSMKMTFHSSGENQRTTRRRREALSKTPLLFFHEENVFGKNRKDKPRQMSIKLIISRGIARGLSASACTVCCELCGTTCHERSRMEPRQSVESFCSKYGQGVTNRAQQPAGHSRFLLLVATFGPKKCAPPVRTSHKWRTSICDSLFSQTRPVSRNMQNTCEKNTCDL